MIVVSWSLTSIFSLLTPDEVAGKLHVTRRTVYTWLRSGKLQGHRIGGVWRIPRSAIDAPYEISPNSSGAR